MLTDLTEACREPIAEMERNGLTADKGWRVASGSYGSVQFTSHDGATAVVFELDAMMPWSICHRGHLYGQGATLRIAMTNAAADGVDL